MKHFEKKNQSVFHEFRKQEDLYGIILKQLVWKTLLFECFGSCHATYFYSPSVKNISFKDLRLTSNYILMIMIADQIVPWIEINNGKFTSLCKIGAVEYKNKKLLWNHSINCR